MAGTKYNDPSGNLIDFYISLIKDVIQNYGLTICDLECLNNQYKCMI